MSTTTVEHGSAQHQPDWEPLRSSVTTAVAAQLMDPVGLSIEPSEVQAVMERAALEGLSIALQELADRWTAEMTGAERYQRSSTRSGYRSGRRRHTLHFRLGPITIDVGRPRRGPSRPAWIPALKSMPDQAVKLVQQLWLRGLSYRDVAAVSEDVLGKGVSHTTAGGWVKDVADAVLRWMNRPVRSDIRYLVLDAVYVPVVRQSSRKEPILVALGITADGRKEILDVLCAPSESSDSWGTLLGRLKLRGLRPSDLELVITDGDEGVRSAIATSLPNVRRQRCTVHKVRNVVGRCSRELKKTAPAEAAKIFKAPSRANAERRAAKFIAKYKDSAPKVAAVIEDDLDAALTFFEFDANHWKALRSTNALERTHRELRRKFREVGAMKAEVNVNRIAVQVAHFVNQQWGDVPIAGFKQRDPGRRR